MLPEASPRVALFVHILVMKIVTPHLRAGQLVVLASVDRVQWDTHRLHERGTGAAEVVWRPLAPFTVGEHERIVVLPMIE